MTKAEARKLQKDLNKFVRFFRLKHKLLKVDGVCGRTTTARVRLVKYYLGYKGEPNGIVTDEFHWRLKHPFWGSRKFNVSRADWRRGQKRRKLRRKALNSWHWSWLWGGCRGVTNEVIHIVGNRAPITSRKRTETFGNPGSDHHVSQLRADAVDFGVGNAYALAHEIAHKLRGKWTGDYDSFYVNRKGKTYRVQIIAGTHGTGPHLHVGVRRV